ncbi:MAG: hypothetical protein S4CHLAM27_12560 [Chlamydiia bacterium]|nr:hypothetical protein [Chlamydiia bacterium]
MCEPVYSNLPQMVTIQTTAAEALSLLEQDKIVSIATKFFENILAWGNGKVLNTRFVLKKLGEAFQAQDLTGVDDTQKKINSVLYIARLAVNEEMEVKNDLGIEVCVEQLAQEIFWIKQTDLLDYNSWDFLVQKHVLFKHIEQLKIRSKMDQKETISSITPFIMEIDQCIQNADTSEFCKDLKQMEEDDTFAPFCRLLRCVRNLVKSAVCLG